MKEIVYFATKLPAMEYEIYRLLGFYLVGWFFYKNELIQRANEGFAEMSAYYNTFFYKILSCRFCSAFWFVLIGELGLDGIPDSLFKALAVAWAVSQFSLLYELFRRRPE